MSSTEIYYYLKPNGQNVIRKFILTLPKNQQAKLRRVLQLISEYGLTSANPHLKKLTGTPLWEIRILGKDNLRLLYVIPSSTSILVLHGFIKKTQKTPPREINIALNRLADWQSRH